ncbi:MAG TPA: antitoxin Xre/MbcA/ParS toxin-binding domain-containing protein [Telluria sp.]
MDNRFAQLIDSLGKPGADPVAMIRKGLPASLLGDAATFMDVSATRLRTFAGLSVHAANALSARKGTLDAAASERLWRLADVMLLARRAFGDATSAAAWMRAPHAAFGHTAPLDWLDTEPGAASVRRVLEAIALNAQ